MRSKALKRVLDKIPRAHVALLKSALSGALIFLIAGCGAVGANPNGPNNPPPQPANPPSIMTSVLPDGTEGDGYSTALSGTGGVTPYSWSIVAGQLPAGLTLDAGGTISGTPAAIGDFAVTIQVRDSSPTQQSASKALPLRIKPRALRVATNSLPSGTVGMNYGAALAATGGTTPYAWSLASGALPPGLTLASAGGISGTLSQSGSFSFTVRVTDSSSPAQTDVRALSLSVAPAPPPPLSITTSSLASGQVGVAYNAALAATGGTTPYTWNLASGTLPPGLTVSSGGAISGTPSQSGSFSFTVRVTDSSSPMLIATRVLSVSVAPAPPPQLNITTNALASGTVGLAYNANLAATGGTTPYSWSLASGTLPPGLTVSNGGVISGTPSQSGTFSFTARVTDSSSPAQSANKALNITIASAPPPPLNISTNSLPSGTVGVGYSATLAATGGTTPYGWSVASGALPPGLTLSNAGMISGTPTTTGSFGVTVRVTDAGSPAQTATRSFTISIAPPPLVITTSSLASGTVGVAYNATLSATGGTPAYTWSIASGALPPGLTLAGTGVISGTPTSAGSFALTVRATDSGTPAQTVTRNFTLTVAPAPLVITTTSLPSGTVGQVYSGTLSATGGTPAYTWSIASGALPPGLSLAATTGEIAGSPSTAGNFGLTFRVTDSASPAQTATKSLTISIANSGPLPGPVAAYAFCEGSGLVTADDSTNSNPGNILDATWTASGKFGNALLFDGDLDHVEADDIDVITPGANATFAAWVSLSTAPTEVAAVFNKWSQTLDDEYIFGIDSARRLYFAWQTTGGFTWGTPSFNEATGTAAIPLSTLTHIAVVRTGQRLDFYINGSLDATVTAMDANPFRNGVNSLRLGGQGRGLISRFFNGLIDEMRIYDRALSQVEIQNDMNTPISVSCVVPVSITTSSLPGGTVGVTYSATLSATGGTPPYSWSIAIGNLPAGLTLSTAGSISGTPTSTGPATFTVRVTDSANQTSLRAFTLPISSVATTTVAFPGAEGGGAHSVGGRGGAVILVTNTNDSGPGSLRACVQAAGPRTCVFRTGGTIALQSSLTVANPFITIAGQTAPGGGIQLRGPSGPNAAGNPALLVTTHNVVIQYLRVRRGHNAGEICNQNPWSCGASVEVLSNATADPHNIVFDHVSMQWSNYDGLIVLGSRTGVTTRQPRSITVSYSIIGEELAAAGQVVAANLSGYSGEGPSTPDLMTDLDLHHNLFVGATHRMPLMTVRSGRLVNNIIYGWTFYGMRNKGLRDFIGNFFKFRSGQGFASHEIQAWTGNAGNDTSLSPSFFLSGNIGPSDPAGTNNWALTALAINQSAGEQSSPLSTAFQRTSPIPTPAGYIPITAEPAPLIGSPSGPILNVDRAAPFEAAGASRKLSCKGDWEDAMDSVDRRIVTAVANGTTLFGSFTYSSLATSPQTQADLGGWPALAAGTPCADSNSNGLPDLWESHWAGVFGVGAVLNPSGNNFGDGYTNLEHYIHAMSPAP